jgi:hypothetical protein
MVARKEVTVKNKSKYTKSTKKEKGVMLDSVCLATGLSRSRVKHLFGEETAVSVRKRHKRGRKRQYGEKTAAVLERIWALMDFSCGRRLVAGMEDMTEALTRFGEIDIDCRTKQQLKEMSSSTADRLLKKPRQDLLTKGKSTTKPGTLLKRDIPLRLGTQWDDAVPGYVEIDLVAHCGTTTAGDYLNTLNITDICTGWTETRAVRNKAQVHVFAALQHTAQQLLFPLRGIDSDNGSEFINAHLYKYCLEKKICFTRSRPNKKNDNCHVEQKNWHIVRRNIGYDRYEGQCATLLMNRYYDLLRLYSNFFLPQTKLIGKYREGAHVCKQYDTPTTPYRRVLRSDHITLEAKEKLNAQYTTLNPAQLKRDMINALEKLMKYRVRIDNSK